MAYKQVWFLGAGFSRAAGYPTMAQFRNAARRLDAVTANFLQSQLRTLDELAAHLLKGSKFFSVWDHDNFEHFASFAALLDELEPRKPSASQPSPPNRVNDLTDLVAAIYATPRLDPLPVGAVRIGDFIADEQERVRVSGFLGPLANSLNFYDAFVLVASGLASSTPRVSDLIITTNYDTTIEGACDRMGIPYNYGATDPMAPPPSKVLFPCPPLTILKLHGSVNWSHSNGKLVAHSPNAALSAPYVYLPILFKGIPTQLIPAWAEAHRAIANTARLVFIGYSLPKSDAAVQTLLYSFVAGTHENTKIAPPPEGDLSVRVYTGPPSDASRLCQNNFRHLFDAKLLLWADHDRQGPEYVGTEQIMQGLGRFLDIHR